MGKPRTARHVVLVKANKTRFGLQKKSGSNKLWCLCVYIVYVYIVYIYIFFFLFEFGTITLKDYILDMVFQHIAQSSPVADEP